MARSDNLVSADCVETVNSGKRDVRLLPCRYPWGDGGGLLGLPIGAQQSLGCDQGEIRGVTRNSSSSGQLSMASFMQMA